jgi:hypothetical protein
VKRRMAQPLIVLPIAAILVLSLFVVGLSAQFQPIVPDIGFEIEGNTALDHGGNYDWENAMPPAIRIPDPNSKIETDPTTFKPNSKFDDPSRWSILPGKVGPGQSELINFLVWDIPPGDLGDGQPNDHWLVLGMERIKAPGYFEMDFEYNQVAWDGSSGGLTRTPGDVLVGFELRGKATSKMAAYKVLLLQYWPGAQPSLCSVAAGPGGEPELVEIGTNPCPPYGDGGWYYRLLADDALSAESGLVQATMNKEPFSPPWPSVDDNGNPVGAIGPYEFAEAAINLTALGIEPDCSGPGSVHAKSRSAPNVHSDLKDLVGPVVLECELARLDGHKFEDIDGDGLWGPDELPLEGWEIRLSDGSVTLTDGEGYYAFEELSYGTYTVSEVCPEGEDWVQTMPTPDDPNSCGGAVYTVTLDGGTPEVNNLNFGNQRPPEGRLDGYKFLDVDGDGLRGPGEPLLEGWEIRLSDGSVTNTDTEGHYAFEELSYGTYTVREVCPQEQGWVQTAPGATNYDTCGSMVHTVTVDRSTPEASDLDFGNGRPALSLEKQCAEIDAGIGYTITVANKGNVLLQDIYVEDPDADFSDTIEQLAPGGSETFTGEYPDGVYENTATATAQYAEATVSAEDTATCPPPPTYSLIVTKDAQTSFTRAYQWTLEKMVDDPGPILLYPGDFAEVNYQVVADLGSPAFVDSNWAVEGTITIFNDSELDTPLALVQDVISPDSIDVAVACDCEAVGCMLAPRETTICTYGPVPLPDGSARTNTVTVTVLDSEQQFSASADIIFDQPTTEIDEEARIADTNWDDEQWPEEQWFDVGAGDTPWVKTYPWKIWAPGNVCDLFDYPNTATLVTNDTGTALTADANVQILEVCEVTMAYEDLPLILGNDWDYNDLVVHLPIELEVSEFSDLLSVSFEVTQEPVLSAFSHAFNLQPCAELCSCTGTWVIMVTRDGIVTTETGVYTPGDNFLLIPNSKDPADLIELRIDFDVAEPGDCPRYCGEPNPIEEFHGEWLFFDPWLTVYPRASDDIDPYEIHVLRPPDDPEPEPRILTVPAAWVPPPEKVPIWNIYPCVQEGNPPIFMPYWWNTDLCMQ